jgi:hypothetical protein
MSKSEMLRRLRLGDLKRLLWSRYGQILPDDDAGRADLELLLDVVSFVPNARYRLKNITETWAPWMDSAAAYELVEAVLRKPDHLRKLKADQLGEKLNLTYEERRALGVRTIAPADLSPDEFADRRRDARRAKDRASKERSRRKAGTKSRLTYLATSLARLKPWAALGISRRTWERRRASAAGVASVSAHKLLDKEETDLRQSIPAESQQEGLPRKRVAGR